MSLRLICKLGYWNWANSNPSAVSRRKLQRNFAAIREEGAKLNSATLKAIGYALALLLETNPGNDDDVPKLTIKICYMSWEILQYQWYTNRPFDRWGHVQGSRYADTRGAQKQGIPFANRNGRPNNSDGTDSQVAKLKKDWTLAQREIAKLKNQLHQAKENIAKERVERGSKSKKDGSPEDEVGSKRDRQQAKQAKTSKQELSSPSPPWNGFRMLPTGEYSSEDEEDYAEKKLQAT
jgi:hypothetical protein